MRLRKPQRGEELGVQMAPLIDCVFLLLIFFLCTSTLERMHRELAMHVPHASVGVESKYSAEPLVIQIVDDGSVLVGETPMTIKMLTRHVAALAREDSHRIVEIDATAPVAFQHIVFLIDLLQDNGLTNVTLAPLEAPPDWSHVGRGPGRGGGGR